MVGAAVVIVAAVCVVNVVGGGSYLRQEVVDRGAGDRYFLGDRGAVGAGDGGGVGAVRQVDVIRSGSVRG